MSQNPIVKKSADLSAVDATTRPAGGSPTAGTASARSVVRPIRTAAILGAVGALVAAIVLPAFATTGGSADAAAVTTEQLAADNAQSIVVASEATQTSTERSAFTATTPEEIEQKKAEEAAAARAAAAAEAAAAAAAARTSKPSLAGYALVSPGTGAVRYPVINFTSGEGPGSGRGHEGWDMIAPQGTPIYAAAGGTVIASGESIGGYGVAVVIMSNINGTMVETRYGHMVYGSRLVQEGEQVSAGQMIGQVGNTGNSYGAHLHFEVRIGGSVLDPEPWLAANAG